MSERVDVAVVGLGALGSMALWRLAERGVRALGIDRFSPPHALGSSHGDSRIIRTAYSEGAFYVPLVREAFDLWGRLEAVSGEALLTRTGLLLIGRPESETIAGALASAREHGLGHRLLDAGEARRRHPRHRVDDAEVAVEEPAAGVLRPEAAVAAALARATSLGAEVRTGTRIDAVEPVDGGVALHAGGATVVARVAVVAPGPWLPALLPGLPVLPWVERQVQAWMTVTDPAAFAPERFPVFLHDGPDGMLRYGFPCLDGATVKVAVHHGGVPTTADTVDRVVSDADLAPLRDLATRWLRGVTAQVARAAVCMYSNTPDDAFLLGAPPGLDGVVVMGGCSGHAFKFAPLLGDVAADLVVDGHSDRQVGAFDPGRTAGPPRAGADDARMV